MGQPGGQQERVAMKKENILAYSLVAAVSLGTLAAQASSGQSTGGGRSTGGGQTSQGGQSAGGNQPGHGAPSGSEAARPSQNQVAVPAATANFLKQVAEGGMTEVQLAKMAREKATSDQVKQLARRLETDHTKTNQELMTLAKGIDVTLPTTMPEANKTKVENLEKLSGAAFDKAYAQQMVEDHQKTIAMFKQHANSPQAEVKQFVSKTLPALEQHLKMAQQAVANTK
jgi:putative membrane protein